MTTSNAPMWMMGIAMAVTFALLIVSARRRSGTHIHPATLPPPTAQHDYETAERARMPAELRSAPLVFSEYLLFADVPVKLAAKVDQVFNVDGVLVPVETKTRYRLEADPYDVLELAVQCTVLRHTNDPRVRGMRVAAYGYVRIVSPGRLPHYVRTDLVDDATVAAYHRRYHAFVANRRPPEQMQIRGAYHRRVCRRCPMEATCSYKPV